MQIEYKETTKWTKRVNQQIAKWTHGDTNKRLNEIRKTMKDKFNKDIESLKKSNWNTGNRKLLKSNNKNKTCPTDWIKWQAEYWGLNTKHTK
jgi:hypothetical protein